MLVDTIVGYTKLYSHIEKVDISFEITNLYLSMLLFSRYNKLPEHQMYWETIPYPFV